MEYQESNARIPFYLTYPMENLYLMEMEYEKDMDRVKALYPAEVRELLPYIEKRCDELEYEGSRIYDENPDREMMDQEILRIYREICQDRGMSGEFDVDGSAGEETPAAGMPKKIGTEATEEKKAPAAGMPKKIGTEATEEEKISAVGMPKKIGTEAMKEKKTPAAGMPKKINTEVREEEKTSAEEISQKIDAVVTEDGRMVVGNVEEKNIIRSEAEGPFTAMSGNGSREKILPGRRSFTFRIPERLAGDGSNGGGNGVGVRNLIAGMQGQLRQMSGEEERILRPEKGPRPPRPGEGPRPPRPGEGPRPPRPGERPRPPRPGEGPRPECNNWLCSMIGILFADEMYRRRCRHRRCERWW